MGDVALGEREKLHRGPAVGGDGSPGLAEPAADGGAAAQGQADEVAAANANAETEQKKRDAANQAAWEALLGQSLGDKLFELVRANVDPKKLTGYAEQGTKAIANQVNSLGSKAFKNDAGQAQALDSFMKALTPELKRMADEWLAGPDGQKLFTAVSEWVKEHPKTIVASLATAAIGAAVAAYLSNMDPPALEHTFKLGRGFKAGGKIDFGPIQKLSVQAAQATVAYESKNLNASITASMENKDGHRTTSVEGKVDGRLGENTTANATARVSNSDQGTSASLEGGVEHTFGQNGKVNGKGSLVRNADGTSQLKLDSSLETQLGGRQLSLGGGVSQTRGGADGTRTQVEGNLKLGDDKDNVTANGTWNPETRAFNPNLGRTTDDGRLSTTQSFGRDAQGQSTSKTSLDYRLDERQKFGFEATSGQNGGSQTFRYENTNIANKGLGVRGSVTQGENAGGSLGVTFDKDKFKSALDLQMSQNVQTLSGSASYNDPNGFTASADFKANLAAGRFDHYGMQIGWRDPHEFRAFMLKYSAEWDEKHPGHKHAVDLMGETVLAGVETRFTGRAGWDAAGNTSFDANVMGAKRLNTDWRALGGVGYKGGQQDGQYKGGMYLQAGVQYKDVPITLTFDPQEKKVMLGITIPFGR